MTTHSKRSPSATDRWINCPGSLKLSEGIPRTESVYAAEGTAAHAVAEECLRTGKVAYLVSEDQEVASSIQVYLADIRYWREKHKVIAEHTERTIYHSDIPEFGGTQDHMMLYEDGDRLICHVFDYKHGVGKVVDAEENQQALSYFAIIQSHYAMVDIAEFRITIVQPRTFAEEKIKFWSCGPERVQQHISEINESIANPDVFKAGDWCGWCPALSICPTVREHALRIAQMEFSVIRNDADLLVELSRIAPAVEKLLKQIPMALLDAYRREPIPGFKVIQTSTHRRWRNQETAATELANLGLPESIIYEPKKMRSVAQLEEELPKDQKRLIEPLYEKPPGGFKVVPTSARGKPVDLTDVSEFEVIEDE